MVPQTDSDYEAARNKLIPAAEAFADREIKGQVYKNAGLFNAAWNRLFHGKMDELAKGLAKR